MGSCALTFVLGVALAPAAAAQYPPTSSTGRVTAGRIQPGGCVTFSGDGFAAAADVAISDNGTSVGSTNASDTGSFSAEVCPTVLGVHLLRGVGTGANGEERTVTAEVTVVAALSATGASNVRESVAAGAGLVLVGSGIVFAVRRRRAVQVS